MPFSMFYRKSYPGSVSDLTIVSIHAAVHEKYLQQSAISFIIFDYVEYVQNVFELWAMLIDIGNIGALEFSRAIPPHRYALNGD